MPNVVPEFRMACSELTGSGWESGRIPGGGESPCTPGHPTFKGSDRGGTRETCCAAKVAFHGFVGSVAMVMFSQWERESSTKAFSVCARSRHVSKEKRY